MAKNKKTNSNQSPVISSILPCVGTFIGFIYGVITKDIVTNLVVGMGFGIVIEIIVNYFKK